MRLGTFVLGGLAGAAVVMLMQNRTMVAVTNGFGQMFRQRMNQVKETAIEKGLNVKFNGGMFQGAGMKNASAHSAGGLDQVKHLASRDSHVKHEVNENLSENGQQQMS